MRMLIISDTEGNIVATAHTQPQEGTPSSVGIIPEPGQTVHEFEVPDELGEPGSVLDLHCGYRLEVKLGVPKLVRVQQAK